MKRKESMSRYCADKFDGSYVTYGHITIADVAWLAARIDMMFMKIRRGDVSGPINTLRVSNVSVRLDADGCGIRDAVISASCDGFSDRPAVTFREDGSVELGAWCEARGSAPVASVFLMWLADMDRRTAGLP